MPTINEREDERIRQANLKQDRAERLRAAYARQQQQQRDKDKK